jgi:hypothetical protein
MFGLATSMSKSTFKVTGGGKDSMQILVVQWGNRARAWFGFILARSIPMVGLEEAADIRATVTLDVVAGL